MNTNLNANAKIALGRGFHAALVARDWRGLRALLCDEATWTLPGENAISGQIVGADAIVQHVQRIAKYGVRFNLLHVLVSRDHLALHLHNTAHRGDASLDEHLTTILRLYGGAIVEMETYLSDLPGMNHFFTYQSGFSKQ